MKHRLTVTMGLGVAVLLTLLGYQLVIIPQRKNINFLRRSLQQVSVHQPKKQVVQTPPAFDAKKELLRWLSDEGRIVSWKKQKAFYSFVWIGSYQAMLTLVRTWPHGLKVHSMHWVKRNPIGVKWSGRYAITG